MSILSNPGGIIYPPEFPLGVSADVYLQLKDYATYMEKDIREVALMAVAATINEYTKNTAIGYLGQRLLGDMKRMMARLKEKMPVERPVPADIYATDDGDASPPGYVENDDEGWEKSDEGSGEEGDVEPEEDEGTGVNDDEGDREMLDASTRYNSNLKNVFGISLAAVIAFTVGYMLAKK